MSGTTNADPDSEGFTCSALLMCLFLPGRSKKKPEEEAPVAGPSPAATETGPAPAPDQPAEQEPAHAHAPGQVASLEKFECASLYSGNNIVYDFVAEEGKEEDRYRGADGPAVQGWCPSPCFDLPVELIRASERCSAVAASDTPVTAAFVFGDYRRGSLRKMASCLAAGAAAAGEPARHQQHLVRFLSASGSSMPRPPVMPSSNGAAVDGDGKFGDGACVQRQAAGPPESVV